MRHTLGYWIRRYSFYFGGDQPLVGWYERFRVCSGALVGLLAVMTIAKAFGELSGMNEWLMASLGASGLLVFALPQSPMSQPWAVIAGNTLSALVGILFVYLVREPLLAMPLAVCLSIFGMFLLRCLHPPAAAVALIAVIGHIGHFHYVLFPVLLDSVLLVLVGGLYSNMTGKSYPNKPRH